MTLLEMIKRNVSIYRENRKKNEKKEHSQVRYVYKSIVADMMEQSLENGESIFRYAVHFVPEKVDDYIRQDGFIVWRNDKIVCYKMPEE